MITDHQYYFFQSALSQDVCNKIMSLGISRLEDYKKSGQSTAAPTMGHNHKQHMNEIGLESEPVNDLTYEEIKKIKNISGDDIEKKTYVRDSEASWLSDKWLYDLIFPYVESANQQSGWKYDWQGAEDFQFTKYNSPGGFYGWHQDGLGDHYNVYKRYIPGVHPEYTPEMSKKKITQNRDYVGKVRKISVTVNLSTPDDYDGGNLKFDFGPHATAERYHECEEIRPQGSIIVFPSHVHHQVTPVTKGTRYSLVLWCLGKPFR